MQVKTFFNSLKNRLALLFFLISAGAMVVVYAYVVPQLKSSLIAEKQRTLHSLSDAYYRQLSSSLGSHLSNSGLERLVRKLAQRSGARVTLLALPKRSAGSGQGNGVFVIADSGSIRRAVEGSYQVARKAYTSNHSASGTETIGGDRLAQVARPLHYRGQSRWVAVFSQGLKDVSTNVSLIQKKIIAAGAIALLVALIVGYLVARAISERVQRLERAAEEVASGQFTNPIPIDSEDELGKLAQTFNEMQSRLRRLDTARKEFIANASHELRTPLFSLAGFVELLQDEELDAATREEFLESIRGQVERLTKLATDLLDLSMLDAGSMVLQSEQVDVVEVARSVAAEFKPAAAGHGTAIEITAERHPIESFCDPGRLAQIIRILLNNALAHTPEGTDITIEAMRSDAKVALIVVDRGPGLSEEEQEHLFDRFYSGDAGKGTGLGLAIAKELAERMEGKLEVSSQPGRTDFKLTLPVAA